jgi:hypothetical protein
MAVSATTFADQVQAVTTASTTPTTATTTAATDQQTTPLVVTGIKPTSQDQATTTAVSTTQNMANTTSATSTSTTALPDMRARLAAQTSDVYGSGILAPLAETSGLLFPYTPSIAVSQDVDYATMQLTHSNMDYYSYSRTPNTSISLTAKFTVQNQREGKYAVAALHFLRTVSKMYFGTQDANAGVPPPVLLFSAYGTYMFNQIRVLLKSHSYSFDENMDLVPITVGNGKVWIPALFSVQLTLTTQPTVRMARDVFKLDDFRSGALLEQGGWI